MLVPPYDDPLIIAGQGTAGREIAEDLAAMGSSRSCDRQRIRRWACGRHCACCEGAHPGARMFDR